VESPPFIPSSTTDISERNHGRLPYHWFEVAELLLASAPDSFINFSTQGISGTEAVRRLLRDLREVRGSKLRGGVKELAGGGVQPLPGVGAMEVGEVRGFITGVVSGLRQIAESKETARREREGESGEGGARGGDDSDGDDMDL
jgi:GINS complex subunit 2